MAPVSLCSSYFSVPMFDGNYYSLVLMISDTVNPENFVLKKFSTSGIM